MSETYEYLDAQDKNAIVINHIRNLEYSMFTSEISIAMENLATTPNATTIAGFQKEIDDSKAKIAALKARLETVTP